MHQPGSMETSQEVAEGERVMSKVRRLEHPLQFRIGLGSQKDVPDVERPSGADDFHESSQKRLIGRITWPDARLALEELAQPPHLREQLAGPDRSGAGARLTGQAALLGLLP